MKNVLSVFILVALASCNEMKVDTKAEGEKLMLISREWSKSAATDSIEKTVSYWADDAVIFSPGEAEIRGKQAIREMVEGASKIPGFRISWEPVSVSVSESGDMAYLIEKSQMSFNDSLGNQVTEYNNAVTIWRRQPDGSWKNVVDIWNADGAQKR